MVMQEAYPGTTNCSNEEVSPLEFLEWMPTKPFYYIPEDEKMWVFWSHDDLPISIFDGVQNWVIMENIKKVLCEFKLLCCPYMLVQFWAPVTIDGRLVLTTSEQPFALWKLSRGLCRYRVHSLKYKFNVDDVNGEIISQEEVVINGPPSRVFLTHLPESNPDVRCYSIEEHPLLEFAVQNEVGAYFALPVFQTSNEDCVGVLELISPQIYFSDIEVFPELQRSLEAWGLKTFDASKFLQSQTIEGLQHAKAEIKEVLEMVCKSHDLPLAQAWIGLPYIHSNPALRKWNMDKGCISFDIGCSRGVLIQKLVEYYPRSELYSFLFCKTCDVRPLKKREGLVGYVLLAHKTCFCKDVSQLSRTEYPLLIYAQFASLSSCFAICLRSTYTGNLEYVLELFLPNWKAKSKDPITLLDSIINTMKQHFRSFKVASGEELGEELSVQLISDSMNDELGSFEICKMTRSLPRPEVLEGEGEVAQPNSSCQRSIVDDATQNACNLVCVERSDTTTSHKMSTVTSVEKPRTTKISLSTEDIELQYGKSMEDAARSLGVSRSTLKRECRRVKIDRWPPPKRNKVSGSCSNLRHEDGPDGFLRGGEDIPVFNGRELPSFDPDIGASQKTDVRHTTPNATPIQNISNMRSVIIEATYGDDTTKFQLSTLSVMTDLWIKVTERLPVSKELFNIKYEDDKGKRILIVCDEDLRDCISRSLDEIKILVMPITNQAPIQEASRLTVKTSYKDDTIKFRLSSLSTIANIEEKIAKSFNLSPGTFRLKYKDEEDDLVSIISDEDLQECMASSRSLNRTTIRMEVHPVTSQASCV